MPSYIANFVTRNAGRPSAVEHQLPAPYVAAAERTEDFFELSLLLREVLFETGVKLERLRGDHGPKLGQTRLQRFRTQTCPCRRIVQCFDEAPANFIVAASG